MDGNIDWGQVIFLALVVIVGFVRWFTNLIEQQKEARERAKLDPEEEALREAAWRRQVGQEEVEPEDPFQELKDLFEKMRSDPQPSSVPPPLPPAKAPVLRRSQPVQREAPPPPPVVIQAVQSPAVELAASPLFPGSHTVSRQFTEAVAHRDRPTALNLQRMRMQLRNPDALRQAILIREILGPPKALRMGPEILEGR